MSRRRSLAFTLIELLTVIAITAILMTIIVIPIVQSFNLTRMAQAFADAQDRARILANNVSREVANAASVRDLSVNISAPYNGTAIQIPASTLMVDVPSVDPTTGMPENNAPTVQALLPYSKLDIMEVAQGQILHNEQTGPYQPPSYVDPRTGYVDPTLQGPRGQVNLPVGVGTTLVRYWVGLHQPFVQPEGNPPTYPPTKFNPYNEPYSDLLMAYNGNRDNLYVLRRAVVQPYVWRPAVAGAINPSNQGQGAFRPNLAFFQADPSDSYIVDEDDPNFFNFIPGTDLEADGITLTASGQAKALRMMNWMGLATNTTITVGNQSIPGTNPAETTLQTDVTRYDLIFPVYDKSSRRIQNVNGVPELISLAQFRPTRITAETVAGETAARLGEEYSASAALAPDVFMSKYAMWSNPIVRTYPIGWQPGATTGTPAIYEVGRLDLTNLLNTNTAFPTSDITIFAYPQQAGTGGLTGVDDQTGGTPLFSMGTYMADVSNGAPYPFSQAIAPYINNLTPTLRTTFIPYVWNAKSGKIITSFGINEVGNPSVTPSPNNPQNLPVAATTDPAGDLYTPSTDPTVNTNISFSQAVTSGNYNSINEAFDEVWALYPNLRPNIHRFMDLRVIPNADGTPSPLYPDYIAGQVTGLGHITDANGNTLYSRVSIVPGTEQVVGPDQRPGPTYGQPIRYTRVTQNPGPDQYCINYTDIPQPTDADGVTVDYSVAFPGFSNPLPTYTPTDFTTAILQPRYKAGYLQLCSDPNIPLPPGNIQVSYRFQVSGKVTGALATSLAAQNLSTADSFTVDYDSRQLMDVLVTVRNFPQTTLNPNPQTVTLKSTASVRNYQR